MNRILVLAFVSFTAAIVSTFAATRPAPRVAALDNSTTGDPVSTCPSGSVRDRGQCRPQRGIVVEQLPSPTPIPMPTVPAPGPLPTPRPTG